MRQATAILTVLFWTLLACRTDRRAPATEPDTARQDDARTTTDERPSATPTPDGSEAVAEATPNGHPLPPRDASVEPGPCGVVPPRMACIPGGPFRRGADDRDPDERPAAEMTVSAFLIDRFEVTNAEFRECTAAGPCERTHHYLGFEAPDQPVVGVDWFHAAAYCAWVGKRLPTEAQWEKAARGTDGRTWPWGDESPSCERAAYEGCEPATTRAVGSFPPGTWGLFDMAGNAFEWVADWYAPCYGGCARACGDECLGADPRGPCGGAAACPGREKRVLRGGSWFWPAERSRTTARRGMPPGASGHRLGFRCALDAPPPGPVGPPPPDAVAPLGERERAIFHGTAQEEMARAPVDARHWVQSNEPRHDDWFPFVDGLGGGYLGVGADQNYTLFARARSEVVWLMDYDVVVVQAHRIYRALILASGSPAEFLLRWEGREAGISAAVLAEAYPDAADLGELQDLLRENLAAGRSYFQRVRRRTTAAGEPASWLADPGAYRFVRGMFAADRVRIVTGDLLGEMPGRIAAAQRDLGMPLRAVYLSNAEQYFDYDDSFRAAFAALPFDERSLILRTVSRRLPDDDRRTWHWQVEPAAHFAEMLAGGLARFSDVEDTATYEPSGGLSRLGFRETP